MLVCRHCGWENPDEAAFCTNCGRGLARGRVITPDDAPTTAGGRFRALGSPVVTVQASEPPRAMDPPLPALKAPVTTGSAPTLLDFRMPEQMLAELARMRGNRSDAPAKTPEGSGTPEEATPADAPLPSAEAPIPSAEEIGPALHSAVSRGLGDIARALRDEARPVEARSTVEQIDPPTLEPDLIEAVDELDVDDEAPDDAPPAALDDAPVPLDSQPPVGNLAAPPPGLFTDPPVQELPFFESIAEDVVSMPPADVVPVDDDEADLPFVLGPELEISPPADEGLAPGDSVDLLPPDGSVDFESEELDRPGETQEDVPAVTPVDESDEFTGLIEAAPQDDGFEQGEALIDDEVEAFIEDVEDDAVLDSGDMEAVVVTQTEVPALRAAPPPMPAAVSARFVLRPLSENLDDSFVVAVGDDPIEIGRLAGDICFEEDRFLSPIHARFEMAGDALQVTDLDSLNGVWLRVRDEAVIAPGTTFLCGQQVIRLEAVEPLQAADSSDGTVRIGATTRHSGLQLSVVSADGEVVTRHLLPVEGCRLGRHVADMVFTRDSFMSGTHALVRPNGKGVILRDLDSRNGTWLQLDGQHALDIGDAVMLGRTVLRVGQPSG